MLLNVVSTPQASQTANIFNLLELGKHTSALKRECAVLKVRVTHFGHAPHGGDPIPAPAASLIHPHPYNYSWLS